MACDEARAIELVDWGIEYFQDRCADETVQKEKGWVSLFFFTC